MDVVATAGHVDHGKSSLVRALTGMEPDRWAEERLRGMTIDLGFAWTTLATGRTVAFVDVPGHQRFIANMLAGAGPAPAVLFVVAADEGWSRQSSDHLAALDALGVRHGLIAITKCDRANPRDALERTQAELGATSLGACDAVAVSAVTGAGMADLRAALDALCAGLEQPAADGRVRLWIDRTFTIRGSGTVVTGTLTSGMLRVGGELEVAGTGDLAHVRGLQSLGQPVDAAAATARVAVNLRGVEPASLVRGQALLTPDAWLSVAEADVRLSGPPAPLAAHLIAHIGSAAVPVRVRALGDRHARLTFDRPLPLAVGDRFVLRDPGQQSIVGGAIALDVTPCALDRRGAASAVGLRLETTSLPLDPTAEVTHRGWVRTLDLVRAGTLQTGHPPPAGVVVAKDWWIGPDRWREALNKLEAAAAAHAVASPLHPGLSRSAAVAAAQLPDPRLLDDLVATSASLTVDALGVRAAGAAELPPAVAAALAAMTKQLAATPFQAPDADTLAALGFDAAALAACVRRGALTTIAAGVYLLPDAPLRAAALLAELGAPFTVSEAKTVLGASRRVAVPLLELLDRLGHTRRVDDTHRIVVPKRE